MLIVFMKVTKSDNRWDGTVVVGLTIVWWMSLFVGVLWCDIRRGADYGHESGNRVRRH